MEHFLLLAIASLVVSLLSFLMIEKYGQKPTSDPQKEVNPEEELLAVSDTTTKDDVIHSHEVNRVETLQPDKSNEGGNLSFSFPDLIWKMYRMNPELL